MSRKIESLYGVDHGARIPTGFLDIRFVPVEPGKKLIEELSSFPNNTRVGIELCSEFYKPFSFPEETFLSNDGYLIEPAREDIFYWRRIIDTCHYLGLETVLLDDFSVYKNYAEAVFGQIKHEERLREIDEGQTFFFSIKRDLEETIYREKVKAKYYFENERHNAIVRNITEKNIDVVIVGRAHGDLIFLDTKQGLEVAKYRREGVDIDEFDTKRVPPTTILEGKFIDEEVDLELLLRRELLDRAFNAVTKWRVLPDKKPDLIGSWDSRIRQKGLFEMYILERRADEISGVIEDLLGTAHFKGKIQNDILEFVKKYDTKRSIVAKDAELVLYKGMIFSEDDCGIGVYEFMDKSTSEVGGKVKFDFVFRKGDDILPALDRFPGLF